MHIRSLCGILSELHDLHSGFPLAPGKIEIKKGM